MRTVTIYEADDGSRWDQESDAACRDELVAKVKEIMAPLGERHAEPGDSDYENGSGYVQHDPDVVASIRPRFSELWMATYGDDVADRPNLMWAARYRLSCIDVYGREWGQPYYANHPHQAKSLHLIERRESKGPGLGKTIVGHLADRQPTP